MGCWCCMLHSSLWNYAIWKVMSVHGHTLCNLLRFSFYSTVTVKRATVSNIQKGRYAFLSPFWDNVSDKAKDFVCHLLVVSPCQRYMATQMLQHPWLEERWEETCGQRDSELSRVLMEHLVTRSATARNAALPTLVETALDKRKSLPNMNLLRRTSFKTHKSS
ncbi:Serine/threonine-protein kinase DCLK3 [Geodia barretti]|uniref:Serine/threonine-protein kinase DCLK3 n=1 Tax=Geodia barretti TaxID=519541 RepID=A0AA35R3I8_GEOBA|nr:Serine/threonine-protein kinase DCLK3 [Geodia barretti]